MHKCSCFAVAKIRGAAPIQWSLLKAEKMTGVTTMLMDEGLDTGDILLQSTLEIDENDNSATLLRGCGSRGKDADRNAQRDKVRMCQADPSGWRCQSCAALRERGRKDRLAEKRGRTRFFCQGMNPGHPRYAASAERIKDTKVRAIAGNGEPGRIEKASGGTLVVGTSKGLLLVEELQPREEGHAAAAFLAGRKLKEGHEKFLRE